MVKNILRSHVGNLLREKYKGTLNLSGIRGWVSRCLIYSVRTVESDMNLGFRMIMDVGSGEQLSACHTGEWEKSTILKCLEFFPDSGVMLDIGANVGLVSCALGSLKKHARIHAIEPVGNNFKRLVENIKLNSLGEKVFPTCIALGDESGRLEMRITPGSSTNNAVGSDMMSREDMKTVNEGNWGREDVAVVTLDCLVERLGLTRCDLIKIDVEGAELNILRGGTNMLSKLRPVIIGEFSPYWMEQINQNFGDVIELMEPFGYEFYIEMNGEYVPVTEDNIAKGLEMPSYLLLPNSGDKE